MQAKGYKECADITNGFGNKQKSTCLPTCAREWQALSAGEGDSLSSSTEKCRIHSAQSSLVLRWLLSHARRSAISFTGNRVAPFAAQAFIVCHFGMEDRLFST
jgi:uncharacterized protein (DUF2235 family)